MANNDKIPETKFRITLALGWKRSNGVLRHQKQRLMVLYDLLIAAGFDIQIQMSDHLNTLKVEGYGELILTCPIDDLPYGKYEDPLCVQLVERITEFVKQKRGHIPGLQPQQRKKFAPEVARTLEIAENDDDESKMRFY